MSRLFIDSSTKVKTTTDLLLRDFTRRIASNPPGVCPVEMQLAFLKVCHAQTCGKCVPCRIGLGQVAAKLNDVLEGKGTEETLAQIRIMSENIMASADCAIGFEAARMVLNGLEGYKEDYLSHVREHKCIGAFEQPIPCVTLCPASVDVPGYIALAAAGRYDDAVQLIRKDNPFPTACALICEHPCEKRCRRNMVDDAVNIRGLKRFVVDHSDQEKASVPACCASTGKRVAVVGSGPSGMTAAYFLQLMGHQVTIYEEKNLLGGMLRYGIPNYRFPRNRLDQDINAILSTGVQVVNNCRVGTEEMKQLCADYDAVYVAIGAHAGKTLGLPGEECPNVVSAVDMLRRIGDEEYPDYTDKDILVIGGGNVAIDCARTAIRCNAKSVGIVYRRRQDDMTALPSEIESAIAEGVELLTLMNPIRIEKDASGNATAVWVQPQVIGSVKNGRPAPHDAKVPPMAIDCDEILVAVGQDIVSQPFADAGLPVKRSRIVASDDGQVKMDKVFAGGECVLGPATVIRAIEMGKVAAANIDEYLGYHHPITCDIDIPEPLLNDKSPSGRVNLREKEAWARKTNFEGVELPMSYEEAMQEAARCLRCDRHGCGTLRGGREDRW